MQYKNDILLKMSRSDILIIIAFAYSDIANLELSSCSSDIILIRQHFQQVKELNVLTDLPYNPDFCDPENYFNVTNCLDIYSFFRNYDDVEDHQRIILYYTGHLDCNGLTITKELSLRMEFLKQTLCRTFGTKPHYLMLFDCCGSLELQLDFSFELSSDRFVLRRDYTGDDSKYHLLLIASTSCKGSSLALNHSFFTWAFCNCIQSRIEKMSQLQVKIQDLIDLQISKSGSLRQQNFVIYSSRRIGTDLQPWLEIQ